MFMNRSLGGRRRSRAQVGDHYFLTSLKFGSRRPFRAPKTPPKSPAIVSVVRNAGSGRGPGRHRSGGSSQGSTGKVIIDSY